MIDGTEREVLELLFDGSRSPTEVAEELGVSVQTASRNLKGLAERGYATETSGAARRRRSDRRSRGYKQYRATEFAHVFAGFGDELFERSIETSTVHRALFSVLKVPQEELHPILLSYLFGPETEPEGTEIVGIVLYGSAARGEARDDSDIDILVVREPGRGGASGGTPGDSAERSATASVGVSEGGLVSSGSPRVISEQRFTVTEFLDALDAGSQFLRNVLDEGIVLYDPEEVIRNARQERAGERVPE